MRQLTRNRHAAASNKNFLLLFMCLLMWAVGDGWIGCLLLELWVIHPIVKRQLVIDRPFQHFMCATNKLVQKTIQPNKPIHSVHDTTSLFTPLHTQSNQ